MQAVGMINEHAPHGFRHVEVCDRALLITALKGP
jgi:hypothetical protein